MPTPKTLELHTKTTTVYFNELELRILLAKEAARLAGLPSPYLGNPKRTDGEPVAQIKIEPDKDGLGYERGYRAFVTITQTFVDREIQVAPTEPEA